MEERFIPDAKTKPRMRQLFNAIPRDQCWPLHLHIMHLTETVAAAVSLVV